MVSVICLQTKGFNGFYCLVEKYRGSISANLCRPIANLNSVNLLAIVVLCDGLFYWKFVLRWTGKTVKVKIEIYLFDLVDIERSSPLLSG